MKMTKQHFTLIAETIAAADLQPMQRAHIARMFAARLSATNPLFDRGRFIEACGIDEQTNEPRPRPSNLQSVAKMAIGWEGGDRNEDYDDDGDGPDPYGRRYRTSDDSGNPDIRTLAKIIGLMLLIVTAISVIYIMATVVVVMLGANVEEYEQVVKPNMPWVAWVVERLGGLSSGLGSGLSLLVGGSVYSRRQTAAERVYEGADIIDSRDVIEALDEMESERQTIIDEASAWAECEEKHADHADAPEDEQTSSEQGECPRCNFVDYDAFLADCSGNSTFDQEAYEALNKFAEEGEQNIGDWPHGEGLIADHYFETYAQELAEDIGAIGRDAQWPLMHIDWKAAAEALKADYTPIAFGSTKYWGRS